MSETNTSSKKNVKEHSRRADAASSDSRSLSHDWLDPRLLDRLQCPSCASRLMQSSNGLRCSGCNASYPIERGVPILLAARPSEGFDYLSHYERDAEVFDYFEERPSGTAHAERRLAESILRELPSATAILDVGSGSAWVARHFQSSDVFVCSLDATIINTAAAIDRYPHNHAAVVADAFHVPFRDGAFGAIVASEIIEHVVDPASFVRELIRVLAPGGSLVISTPYKERLRYTLCIHCNQNTPLNAHLHSFDEHVLTKLYSGSDLERVTWRTFGNKALLHLRMHGAIGLLPFAGWKLIDEMANAVVDKRAHIVVRYEKKQ